MRFPRQAKIFRGQLDTAPLAGVFFLLVIFLLLCSLIYTPGMRIDLSPEESFSGVNDSKKMALVTRAGEIYYENKIYNLGTLEVWRSELKKLPAQSLLVLRVDPLAPRDISGRLRKIASEINLGVELRRTGIELPESDNASGTLNPTAVVAVNFGQFFYQNRLIKEEDLRKKLQDEVRRSANLTLVVMADKATEIQVITQLKNLAIKAGVKEMVLQTRPRPFTKAPSR
ncbi:MAG: ExbD/TolR family protein [Limisphaerales bacterium]